MIVVSHIHIRVSQLYLEVAIAWCIPCKLLTNPVVAKQILWQEQQELFGYIYVCMHIDIYEYVYRYWYTDTDLRQMFYYHEIFSIFYTKQLWGDETLDKAWSLYKLRLLEIAVSSLIQV